jgi:ketosteroid isomerase-like protein
MRSSIPFAFTLVLALGIAPGGAIAADKAGKGDKAEVMATVRQFIDGFNKGDAKTALAACASPAAIIDEFPPHAWQGPTACADWANDFEADSKKNGITDQVVKLAKPRHVDVTGDRAYVVVPANYAYKKRGKAISQVGSTFTAALQKGPAGWRITSWTWSTR